MKLFILFLITSPVFAAEVATLDEISRSNELQVSFTDETLLQAMEKQFMGQPCKTRNAFNPSNAAIRDHFVPLACRAEITKFLLNSGYKHIDRKTFYK